MGPIVSESIRWRRARAAEHGPERYLMVRFPAMLPLGLFPPLVRHQGRHLRTRSDVWADGAAATTSRRSQVGSGDAITPSGRAPSSAGSKATPLSAFPAALPMKVERPRSLG